MKYMNENLGHNTIDPRRGFDLDLTIGEAIKIQETIASLKEKVQNGELQNAIDEFKNSEENLATARNWAIDTLGAIYD